ncbi:MAG: UDP-N-acetylglucosamine 2-epimerase [archaeon]
MKIKNIVYISGTRADYGLMRSTLREMAKRKDLKLYIAATGMHLMPEFGMTINEIKRDGFEVHELRATYERDDRSSTAEFVGELIGKLTALFNKKRPDLVLLLGDRAEMLAGAIVGQYMGLPVAQIHGGEVTSTVDEAVRHAITKLSHIHLAATKESADRIIKMGENPKDVFVVGAPGLDEINDSSIKDISRADLEKSLGIRFAERFAIVLQHPVSGEIADAKKQMKDVIEATIGEGLQAVVIYPNADAGGRAMIQTIEEYRKHPSVRIFKNVPREEFLGLMKHATVMVGNSSSGIIESSSFKLPVVNVGSRQEGRQRGCNVIDSGYSQKEISEAIRKALQDKKFKDNLKHCENPYGDGKTGKRIAKLLADLEISDAMLQKKIMY